MTTLVYIISRVSHSLLFEWTATMLDRKKYRLVVILMHDKDSRFEQFLRREGFTVYRIPYQTKYEVPKAVLRIRRILKKEKAEIVHTHLFEAGLAGMMAARLAGVKKRIHTRHDATIHLHYHPKAVKYDKAINRMASTIIAVTNNVKSILIEMEGADASKIEVVRHRFKLEEFEIVSDERVMSLREKYFKSSAPFPVIGVVSRFIEWKGIQYIIPAFEKVLNEFPNAKLLLANAQGPYSAHLIAMLNKLPKDSYQLVEFEHDIVALYRLFDIFVHVPVSIESEAFGQVYVEAVAAGVPSVITQSGIAPDFVTHEQEALVVPYRNSDAIANAILRYCNDKTLRTSISERAKKEVHAQFRIADMIKELEAIYDK